MDIFTDDEPDFMGLELVREFDNLARKFYSDFDDDLDEWTDSSEIYVCIKSEVVREEVDIVIDRSHPVARPNKHATIRKLKRKVETVPVSNKTIEFGIEKVGQNTSKDVIVSDKNIKIVLQLPTNNKKGNIKDVAYSDNSITISHLNNEGIRCTYTLDVPYNIDFDTAKATYKNGILEVTFDRK